MIPLHVLYNTGIGVIKKSQNKQLWINDLCRINNSDMANYNTISPVMALFESVEIFSKTYGITQNHIAIDNGTTSTAKLIGIYTRYKFFKDDKYSNDIQIVMKKYVDGRW